MKTSGLAHVALPVADLAASKEFYENGMGFAADPARPDFGFPGAWLNVGAHQVHLMELGPVTPDHRQHFAIQVDDLDAATSELEGKGIKVNRVGLVPGAGRQAFLSDPDGHQIELNQPGA